MSISVNVEQVKKTLLRMIIIGVGTLVFGVIVNQFIPNGIRLPILLNSIPSPFLKKAEAISQNEALSLLNEKKVLFVDARSEIEFDMDHIEGALSISVVDFLSKPKLLDSYKNEKSLPIILYSAKEIDDNIQLLARFLMKKGAKDVKVLSGGFEQWLKNDFPVEF